MQSDQVLHFWLTNFNEYISFNFFKQFYKKKKLYVQGWRDTELSPAGDYRSVLVWYNTWHCFIHMYNYYRISITKLIRSPSSQINNILNLKYITDKTYKWPTSRMIPESAMRDKCPLDSMSEINCQGEIMPQPRIELVTPGLHIWCSIYTYWANRADQGIYTLIGSSNIHNYKRKLDCEAVLHAEVSKNHQYQVQNMEYLFL